MLELLILDTFYTGFSTLLRIAENWLRLNPTWLLCNSTQKIRSFNGWWQSYAKRTQRTLLEERRKWLYWPKGEKDLNPGPRVQWLKQGHWANLFKIFVVIFFLVFFLDDDVEVLVDRVQHPLPLLRRLLRWPHHRTCHGRIQSLVKSLYFKIMVWLL